MKWGEGKYYYGLQTILTSNVTAHIHAQLHSIMPFGSD
jgi:hypothetical protein